MYTTEDRLFKLKFRSCNIRNASQSASSVLHPRRGLAWRESFRRMRGRRADDDCLNINMTRTWVARIRRLLDYKASISLPFCLP
jgi:hypothetical protein